MGVTLPIDDVVDHRGATIPESVELRECTCGLHYFTPVVVGGPDLYTHLAADGYYRTLRWDQRVALHLVQPRSTVLDLGSGGGAFVRAVAKKGGQATGVDFSAAPASDDPAARFVVGSADLTDEAVSSLAISADLVTAFQLVEHLADPVGFVMRAAALVRPGGRLVISVPNRARFEIDPIQALDCPPHHQTRWAKPQLSALGERSGLIVESIVAQRSRQPLRLAHRVARRVMQRPSADWTLPPAARPWPPTHIVNEMSLVAIYRPR